MRESESARTHAHTHTRACCRRSEGWLALCLSRCCECDPADEKTARKPIVEAPATHVASLDGSASQQSTDSKTGVTSMDMHADSMEVAMAGSGAVSATHEQPGADIAGELVLGPQEAQSENAPDETVVVSVADVTVSAAQVEAGEGAGSGNAVEGHAEAPLTKTAATVAETMVHGAEAVAPAGAEAVADMCRLEDVATTENAAADALPAGEGAVPSVAEAGVADDGEGTVTEAAEVGGAATRAPADEAALHVEGGGREDAHVGLDHVDAVPEREAAADNMSHPAPASAADSGADSAEAAGVDAGIELNGSLPDGAEVADFFTDA